MLKDAPALNRTTLDEEFSDLEIDGASDICLMMINSRVPRSTYTIEDAPEIVLLYGTIYFLLKSAIALKMRNYLTVNTGEVSYNKEENLALYEQLMSKYEADFQNELVLHKTSMNIYGGMQ